MTEKIGRLGMTGIFRAGSLKQVRPRHENEQRRCVFTEKFQRTPLKEGIYFTSVHEDKFKYNHISINFVLPLRAETASLYALLPMVLRRGCRAYPDMTALNARLAELYGAQLEWDVSKRGETQIVTLYIEVLGDRFALEQEELLKAGVSLLRDVVFDPAFENAAFRAADVAVEKRNLADIIRSKLNDKRAYASYRLREEMCRGEAFGVNEYGSVEMVEAITPDALVCAWREVLTRARAEVLFVGAGDADGAREVFKLAFNKILRDQPFFCETQVIRAPRGVVKETVEHLPVTQAKLGLGFRAGVALPDAEADAAQLACTVLGGSPHALLFLNVREKLSLCYYCYARYERHKGLVFIESGVEEQNAEKARVEILRQLDALKAGDFSDDDLRFAVLSLQNSYKELNDSLEGIAMWYLAQALVGRIRTPEQVAEAIAALSKAEVVHAASGIALDTVYLLAGEKEAE
ncbi:EF-P 5-aminopentanol modification-associated protein YfmF [Ethanoligenens sp.]|uniref:EF-P 5-aminopentanol modification-associated protein YfmF n=1 Tax=Ethanoligenens sp. TaxID=2099655 RepID=UPI0039ED6092